MGLFPHAEFRAPFSDFGVVLIGCGYSRKTRTPLGLRRVHGQQQSKSWPDHSLPQFRAFKGKL